MFVVIVALLAIAVVLFIAWPLFRKTPKPLPHGIEASRGEELLDLEIEKQNILASLRDLESDLLGGKLSPTDYERLKDIDEHRLAAVLAGIDGKTSAGTKASGPDQTRGYSPETLGRFRTMNMAGSLLLLLLIAGGALGIYYYQNAKLQNQKLAAMVEEGAGSMMDGTTNPLDMVARLERKLRENPDDLQGQVMAGRSYMTLQRTEDARKAWSKVIELDPANIEAHYSLGLLLIQTANLSDPRNFEQAIRHLDEALLLSPGMPAALFYRGVALTHLKRYDEAAQNLKSALQGLPPGSEEAEFVKEELRKLQAGNP